MTPTPLPFTPAEFDVMEKISRAATQDELHVVEYYENSIAHHLEAYERMMREGYMDGPDRAWPAMHFVQDVNNTSTIAITGNGPKSRANAKNIATFANPATALRLIALARVSLDRDRTQAIVDAARALMQSIPATIWNEGFGFSMCVACDAKVYGENEDGTSLPIAKHDDGCAWEAMHNLLEGARKAGAGDEKCEWKEEQDGLLTSSCENAMLDWKWHKSDTFEVIGLRFCPYCGKPIATVPYVEEESDE